MLVRVWWTDELVELTEELTKKMQKEADDESGRYNNFVLSMEWKDGYPSFFLDGPWEC